MTGSTKLWFEVAAVAITITAVLAIIALAIRVGDGLTTATSIFATFFCAFVGIAVKQRRVGRRDPVSVSIKDELDLRKLRSQRARVQFR